MWREVNKPSSGGRTKHSSKQSARRSKQRQGHRSKPKRRRAERSKTARERELCATLAKRSPGPRPDQRKAGSELPLEGRFGPALPLSKPSPPDTGKRSSGPKPDQQKAGSELLLEGRLGPALPLSHPTGSPAPIPANFLLLPTCSNPHFLYTKRPQLRWFGIKES